MSLHNDVKKSMVLSSLNRYLSRSSATEEEKLMDVLASDERLLSILMETETYLKTAAADDDGDEENPEYEAEKNEDAPSDAQEEEITEGVEEEEALKHLGNDSGLARGFNSLFRQMLVDNLGDEFFAQNSDTPGGKAVLFARKKAIQEFYNRAKKRLLSTLRKTYSQHMKTPNAKKMTLTRYVYDDKANEYVKDDTFKPVEVEDTGVLEGDKQADEYPLQDALDAIMPKVPNTVKKKRNPKDWGQVGSGRGSRTMRLEKPIQEGDEMVTYNLKIDNVGDFLEKANVTLNPKEVAQSVPGMMKDMFLYYDGAFDQDVDGSGAVAFDNVIRKTFSKEDPKTKKPVFTEKGEYFEEKNDLETVFAPKIDSQRYKQLQKLYGTKKKAFNDVDPKDLKDMDALKQSEEQDLDPDFKIGDVHEGSPDTLLVNKLHDYKSFDYKVVDKDDAKKNQMMLTIEIPGLIESGFLEPGQKYKVLAPSPRGFNKGETYTFNTVREKSPRSRSIKVEFHDQTKAKKETQSEAVKDVGLTGSEIKQLSDKMVDTFVSSLQSMNKEDFIKYFGKTVILNDRLMSDGSDLGKVIRSEEEEYANMDPDKIKGKQRAEQLLEKADEFKQEAEQKVEDKWEKEELVKYILSKSDERDSSPLINKILKAFPWPKMTPHLRKKMEESGGKEDSFPKAAKTRPFVKWLLETMAFATEGLPQQIDKTPTWMAVVRKKLDNGEIFKDSPEFDEIYSGPRNSRGGVEWNNMDNINAVVIEPIMKKIEDSVAKLYQSNDEYLLKMLRASRGRLDKPLAEFNNKYEGYTDEDGVEHVGLEEKLSEAIEGKKVMSIMRALGLSTKNWSKPQQKFFTALNNADSISKADSKKIWDWFDERKQKEKREIYRKAMNPTKKSKTASIDRSFAIQIVNTVMKRRGYYNV